MKSLKFMALITLCAVTGLLLVGCNRPEYLNPYGEGVDPSTVATIGFQSRPASTTTGLRLDPTTTTEAPTTTTTQVVVPDGYQLCPTCGGQLQVCEYCHGTNRRQGETLDADSGVFKRYYVDCQMCSAETPGYYLCETCKNKLIVRK